MWAACCAHRPCSRPGPRTRPARSTSPRCAQPRTRRSGTAVAMQERVGLQAATDGEFRRTSWHMDFIYRLGGIEKTDERIEVRMHGAAGDTAFTSAGIAVRSRVRLDEPIFADDFLFLAADGDHRSAEADDPVAEHGPLPRRDGGDRPHRLPGRRGVLGRPLRRLRGRGARAGRPRLPLPAARRHEPGLPQRPRAARRDGRPRRGRRAPAPALHRARSTPRWPAGPTGMRVTTHMCRGNYRSSWAAEGGYDFVAEALFGELDVDGFFCEFDDERSGGFRAAAVRAAGQAGGARARHHQARRAGGRGRAQAAHRRGREVRAARPAVPVAAVRLLLDRRGQRADGRRAGREAAS